MSISGKNSKSSFYAHQETPARQPTPMDIEEKDFSSSNKCQAQIDHHQFFASISSKAISDRELHDQNYAIKLKDAARVVFERQMRPLIALSRLTAIDHKRAIKAAEYGKTIKIPTKDEQLSAYNILPG